MTDFKKLETLNKVESATLAISSYHWYYFNNISFIRRLKDLGIKLSPKKVFEFYYTKHPEYYELNHQRYVNIYKNYMEVLK